MHGIVGIGLVALDIVIDDGTDERIGAWAGGSCGNVMTILSWLGWRAAPVARLGHEHNARLIREDLQRWNVDQHWLTAGSVMPAPIFIERLRVHDDGAVTHRYERFCPACGGRLPRYQPVPRHALAPVIADLGAWDVVYIDRSSAGAVLLAQEAREKGLTVFFEPSARGTAAHIEAIASSSDIVKYSSDRLTEEDREIIGAVRPALEVETFGANGLRFRRRGDAWSKLAPAAVDAQDTAGAGDWTTAGILVALDAGNNLDVESLSERQLRSTLGFAQAMGAWSCRFRGPRGAMERHSANDARAAITAILHGDRHATRRRRAATSAETVTWTCEDCR